MRRVLIMGVALVLLASACGSDGDTQTAGEPASNADTASATDTTTTSAPTTIPPTTTEASEPTPSWVQINAEGCVCSDGSDYTYWLREADPTRVMLFFDGGGACFSAETCNPEDPAYSTQADDNMTEADTGVFDLANPANPVANWSMIFMPYCTGDVHLGTNTEVDYGDGIVVNHLGYTNAENGLDALISRFPNAEQILVTGSSAGGVPTPLFAGLVADAFPDADVMGLPDGSGGYPSNPGLNALIGNLWGTSGAIPDWTSTADVTAAEFGIPDLYGLAATEFPAIRWARFDHAYDGTQATFSALAGLADSTVKAVLDINEALAESSGIDLDVYVAPGTEHTILARPEMYDLEVNGTRFVDWFSAFLAGDDISDVVCVDCEQPG